MKKLSQEQVHDVVEYIRSVGVDFDAADLDDLEGVETVLWRYGFFDGFPEADLEALRQELLPLGLEHELAEISRVVEEDPLLVGVGRHE